MYRRQVVSDLHSGGSLVGMCGRLRAQALDIWSNATAALAEDRTQCYGF